MQSLYSLTSNFEKNALNLKDTYAATNQLTDLNIIDLLKIIRYIIGQIATQDAIKEKIVIEAQSISDYVYNEINRIVKTEPDYFKNKAYKILSNDVKPSEASNALQFLYNDLMSKANTSTQIHSGGNQIRYEAKQISGIELNKHDVSVQASMCDRSEKDLQYKINVETLKSKVGQASTKNLQYAKDIKILQNEMTQLKDKHKEFLSQLQTKLYCVQLINEKTLEATDIHEKYLKYTETST